MWVASIFLLKELRFGKADEGRDIPFVYKMMVAVLSHFVEKKFGCIFMSWCYAVGNDHSALGNML